MGTSNILEEIREDAEEMYYIYRLYSIKYELDEIKDELRKLQDNLNKHWNSEEEKYIYNFIGDTVRKINIAAHKISTIAKDITK